MTWPVPSQPGVGHLISRFSGREGSRDSGGKGGGKQVSAFGGEEAEKNVAKDACHRYSRQTGKKLQVWRLLPESGL